MDRACLPSQPGLPCWHAGVCGSAGVFLKSECAEKHNKPSKQKKEGPCENERMSPRLLQRKNKQIIY